MRRVGHNNRLSRIFGAACLGLVLVGCSSIPPFNRQPVVMRAPAPPQILSSHSTEKGLKPCPQPLIAQTQWLQRNMARVRLGFNKLQTVSIVGDPAHAETFSLKNGAVVEVLFYHTPETICRVSARDEGLMPFVFQDDRLLGYGPNYYRDFIVPQMRPKAVEAPAGAVNSEVQGIPQPRVSMTPTEALRPAPARTGRWEQEDLPTPPTANRNPPPVSRGENGYSSGMTQDYYPVRYAEEPRDAFYGNVGRGEPLR